MPQGGTPSPAAVLGAACGAGFWGRASSGHSRDPKGTGPGGSFPADADCAGEAWLSFPERAALRWVCSVSQHPELGSRARAFSLSGVGEDVPASLPRFPSRGCETSRGAVASSTRHGSATPRVGPSGGPCITLGTLKPPVLGLSPECSALQPLGHVEDKGQEWAGAPLLHPRLVTPHLEHGARRAGRGGSRSSCRGFL